MSCFTRKGIGALRTSERGSRDIKARLDWNSPLPASSITASSSSTSSSVVTGTRKTHTQTHYIKTDATTKTPSSATVQQEPLHSTMYSNTRAQQTEMLESGHTYRLTQAKTRTVLDLSMKDWSSVRSTAWDASDNQKVRFPCSPSDSKLTYLLRCAPQWVAELAESGSGWTFRSVATGLFLSVEGTPRPNASVVATREVTTWDLYPARDPSTVRYARMRPKRKSELTKFFDSGSSSPAHGCASRLGAAGLA